MNRALSPTWRLPSALLAAALLAACGTVPPPQAGADGLPRPTAAPVRWQPDVEPSRADLPHQGDAGALRDWWARFDDPLVPALVDAAQRASPTVAQAASRIEEARAARTAAASALGPAVDAGASASRGRSDPLSPPSSRVATSLSASVQASWELDLFGGGRAGLDAADARLRGVAAGWHEARVSVAAEAVQAYVGLRACEARLALAQTDARSRDETARLTELSVRAGTRAPAAAAQARAAAAQGRNAVEALRQQCTVERKALTALTGLDDAELRQRLVAAPARLPQPAGLAVDAVPAAVLDQRPDLQRAALDVQAAASDIDEARADRLPRVTLAGSIGPARLETAAARGSGLLWSVGPVQVSLPLFDGGRRAAQVDAARARYDAAVSTYGGTLRQAVREVETSLVALQGTAQRGADAEAAAADLDASLRATDDLYRGGFASLFDLEDARRAAVQARRDLIDLQQERLLAWIGLYRALGGGWEAADLPPPRAATR